MDLRPLGRTGLSVTPIGLGCAPLGNLFGSFDDAQATATVAAAFDAGVGLFDTAPLYGSGLSESRLGAALAGRHGYVLSTKVGRVLRPGADPETIFADAPDLHPVFDWSETGVRESLSSSLDRLGVDRVDLALVHDPDDHLDAVRATGFPALRRLRDERVVGAVGAGMNQVAPLRGFVDEDLVDVILLAGRWSLLDHTLDARALLDRCHESGVGVLLGGVFNSGLLAGGDTFDYAGAPADLVARRDRLAAACAEAGTTLPAAAIAFAAAHPAVSSLVLGCRTPDEVTANVAACSTPPPASLWDSLVADGLLDAPPG